MSDKSSEVKDRARLIRNATPDILESLYEMSNRICDLCGHPIQDLICAALDHSIPVIHFARSDMPIDEAIVQANDPQNLRCAHASCNNAKNGLTREEWFVRGLNERDAPRFMTDGQLLKLQFRLGAGGRRLNELYPEMAAANGRARGRSDAGRKHMAAIGRMAAERNRAASMSGQLAKIRTPESRAKGGHITGCRMKKEKRGIHAPGMAEKAARISNHNQWHLARGISNPNCALCNHIGSPC